MGGRGENPAFGRFVRQLVVGGEVGGPRRARVDGHQPRGLLALQVGIVGKLPARQEVPLDVLDQRLDRSLLVGGTGGTRFRVEAKFCGHLQQRRRPDWLVLVVPTRGDDFHVVEDDDPGHEAQRRAAVDESTQQRFLTHVRREADPHPPAVLQSASQEVAWTLGLLGEREARYLTPVHLEVLGGQALEAHRHGRHRLAVLLLQPLLTHYGSEDRMAAGVRPLGIGACLLQHPHRRQPLSHPAGDLLAVGIDQGRPLPFRWWLVNRPREHPRDRLPVHAQLLRNLPLAQSTLVKDMDRTAFHLP